MLKGRFCPERGESMSAPDSEKPSKDEQNVLVGKRDPVEKADRNEDAGEKEVINLDDTLAQMETIFEQVESAQPRLGAEEEKSQPSESGRVRRDDLEALLDISKAINSTLVLDDILQMVMRRASKLLRAERGF